MGLLGPRLVKFPGYPELEWPAKTRLEDNAEWLLDCCDIVLADPPGAGWARLLDEDAAGEYYSVGGDARAFARFIGAWLRENGREASPVYLLGESYGTIRSVALADCLPEDVRLAGIISVGTSLNVGSRGTLYVEPNVRRLGANAACCWFHHHRGELPLEDFVREAMDFAYGAYARALLLGNRLPEAEREDALDKLAYFTGVDRGFLAENRLRFGEPDFLLRCCPGRGAERLRLAPHLRSRRGRELCEQRYGVRGYFRAGHRQGRLYGLRLPRLRPGPRRIRRGA